MAKRVLVASLGNPDSLRTTWHSAGHIVLESLIKRGLVPKQPPFEERRFGKNRGRPRVSIGDMFTFAQSPVLMNLSGPWVSHFWRDRNTGDRYTPLRYECALLLVHDDLEVPLGQVKRRDWHASARGHNGLKSVLQHSQLTRNDDDARRSARISIGIGRPQQRDQDVVSDFVLSQVPREAMDILEGPVTTLVWQNILDHVEHINPRIQHQAESKRAAIEERRLERSLMKEEDGSSVESQAHWKEERNAKASRLGPP